MSDNQEILNWVRSLEGEHGGLAGMSITNDGRSAYHFSDGSVHYQDTTNYAEEGIPTSSGAVNMENPYPENDPDELDERRRLGALQFAISLEPQSADELLLNADKINSWLRDGRPPATPEVEALANLPEPPSAPETGQEDEQASE